MHGAGESLNMLVFPLVLDTLCYTLDGEWTEVVGLAAVLTVNRDTHGCEGDGTFRPLSELS